MKKLMAVLIVIVMAITLVPISVSAGDPAEVFIDFTQTTTVNSTTTWSPTNPIYHIDTSPGYTVDRTKSGNQVERKQIVTGVTALSVLCYAPSNGKWPAYKTTPANIFTIDVTVPGSASYKVSMQNVMVHLS